MKIIFDFDHTLFSSKRFFSTFRDSILKLGVTEKLFQVTFRRAKGEKNKYRPARQFKLIIEARPNISLKELEKAFQKVLDQSKHFLYSDVLSCLKKIKNDFELILLSYGEDEFQGNKIRESKITNYFKKFFITKDINKTSISQKILKRDEKIIFVDDRPITLSEFKKKFPKAITIRMKRRDGKYSKEKNNEKIDFSVKNLKELEKIIYNIK